MLHTNRHLVLSPMKHQKQVPKVRQQFAQYSPIHIATLYITVHIVMHTLTLVSPNRVFLL